MGLLRSEAVIRMVKIIRKGVILITKDGKRVIAVSVGKDDKGETLWKEQMWRVK